MYNTFLTRGYILDALLLQLDLLLLLHLFRRAQNPLVLSLLPPSVTLDYRNLRATLKQSQR